MFLNYILPLIITTICIILFVVLCTIKYKNASEQQKLKPIRIVFYILVVLEVAKIVYLIGERGVFEPLRYPIVFCSMILYAFPLFCFKSNKFSEVAKSFSVLPSIVVFILFAAVQWDYNMSIIQAHSYVFHGAMLAVAIYLLTSKLYRFEFKKFYSLFLALSSYIGISAVLSLFIGGEISIFGPKSSYISIITNNFGYGVGICILLILGFLLCFLTYGIIALFQRKKKVAQNDSEKLSEVKNV